MELSLKSGHKVVYRGKPYRIESPINLTQILLENAETGEKTTAKITELTPVLSGSYRQQLEFLNVLRYIGNEFKRTRNI